MATCLQVTTEGKPQLGVTNTDPFASLWGHQDDCPCASRCFPPKCAQASFAARPVGSKAPLEIPQTCMAVQQEKTQMTEVAGQSPGHSAGWDWAAGRNRRKTVAEEHAITRPTSKVDDPGVTPPPSSGPLARALAVDTARWLPRSSVSFPSAASRGPRADLPVFQSQGHARNRPPWPWLTPSRG